MATLKIETIETVTAGGHIAEIRGISNDTTDCLSGVIIGSNGKENTVHWDLYGRARDHDDSCNLDMRKDKHFSLRSLAITLLNDYCKEYYKNIDQ